MRIAEALIMVDTRSVVAMPIDPDDVDDAEIEADPRMAEYEAELAERRNQAISAGRRKGGAAGGAMAAAMLALRDVIEGPPKEDAPVTVEASGDPLDLEKDGFGGTFGEVVVEAPPLERLEPVTNRKTPRR